MNNESETQRLGDMIEILTGFPFESASYTDDVNDIRLLRGDNIGQGKLDWGNAKRWPIEDSNDLDKYHLLEGDIVLAMDRPWIKAGLKYAVIQKSDLPCLLVQRVARIRPKNGYDSRFITALIDSWDFTHHILNVQTGTAVPHISSRQILEYKSPKIGKANRAKIAIIRGLFDSKISVNQLISETAIEFIETLFKSWFIDFDPVKAKAEDKLPYGMGEETLALFSDSFQETEIGMIPVGWTVKKIGDIADLTKGLSYKGAFLEETNDEGKKMMNLGCFGIDGSFRRNKIKYYSGEHKERHLLEDGDLLIANTDMTQDRVILGACIIIPSEYEGALFTHHTTRLRVHKNLDSRLNSFIAYKLSQITFRHIAEGYSTGSTVLALPKDAVLNYKIAVPPKELLDKFLRIEGDFFSQSQVLISTEEYLRNTRDALLARLMSGELSVS